MTSTRPARRRRKRNLSPLLLLSALLAAAVIALPAEASLPRTDANTASPAALAGSEAVHSGRLIVAGLETPFTLLAGDELVKALACSPALSPDTLNLTEEPPLELPPLASRACEGSFSLHLEPPNFGLNQQRGPPFEIQDLHQGWFVADPKTRIGGFRLNPEDLIGGEHHLTLGLHWGYLVGRPGLTEDEPPDPWGLQARALRTVPEVIPECIEPAVRQDAVPPEQANLPRAARPVINAGPRFVNPVGSPEFETLKARVEWEKARPPGPRALGGRTADQLSSAEQQEFLENQRRLRTDPQYRASVESFKGALSKIKTKGASSGGGPVAAAGGTGGEEPPDDFVVTPWGTRDLRTGKFAGGERGGKDPVQDFIEHAKANGFEVVGEGEITVKTPFVNRRPDVVLRNPQTGRVGGVEIKSTPEEFAKTNPSQAAADRWINTFGARAVGRNAESAGVKQLDYMMKIQWPPN